MISKSLIANHSCSEEFQIRRMQAAMRQDCKEMRQEEICSTALATDKIELILENV